MEKKLKIQGYQQRYFVLRSKTLVYYKSHADAEGAPEKPLGVIPLKVRRRRRADAQTRRGPARPGPGTCAARRGAARKADLARARGRPPWRARRAR